MGLSGTGNTDKKAILNHALAGDETALDRIVNPPGSASVGATTDNAAARFNGTDGALQDSGVLIDDSDNVTGMGTLSCGAITSSGSATCTGVVFPATAVTPTVTQSDETTASTNGDDLGVKAQSATGATSNGGTAYLQGGTGTGTNGSAELRDSAGNVLVEAGPGANELGFYAATPVAKQTVTGSTGANAALQDLLAKLETLGLITDSTT